MDLTPKSRGTSSKPIIHNDQQFVLGYPLKDGTLLYKCCERSCLARIKVDEKNFLVLKELSNHSGHRSPLTNSAKAKTQSNSSIINDKVDATHSNVADTSAASNPRHDALKKSCSTPSANQSHHESEASEPRRSRSSADLSSTFDISHTSAPGTQDAPRTSPIPSAGDDRYDALTVALDSDSSQTPLQSPDYYKIKFEQLYELNHSLIDKIIEKERTIWTLERETAELRDKIQLLEANSRSPPSPSGALFTMENWRNRRRWCPAYSRLCALLRQHLVLKIILGRPSLKLLQNEMNTVLPRRRPSPSQKLHPQNQGSMFLLLLHP